MELMYVLAMLWRRRVLVLLGLIPALALATLPGGGTTTAGTALSRVLVDTPDSMLTNVNATGSFVSGMRAALLADELSGDRAKAEIARRAGIRDDELVIHGATAEQPLVIGPLAERAAIATAGAVAGHVLSILPESRIPIVRISAYAPDVPGAERLAEAATATLASLNTVPAGETSGAVVRPLGTVQANPLVSGGSKKKAMVAGLALFILWCTSIVLLSGFVGWWRELAARDAAVVRVPRPSVRESLAFVAGVVSSDVRGARRRLARIPARRAGRRS